VGLEGRKLKRRDLVEKLLIETFAERVKAHSSVVKNVMHLTDKHSTTER
jgi:hypothetical protein